MVYNIPPFILCGFATCVFCIFYKKYCTDVKYVTIEHPIIESSITESFIINKPPSYDTIPNENPPSYNI